MDSVAAELQDWLAVMPEADGDVEALRQRIGRLSRLFGRVLDEIAEAAGISVGDLATLSALARAGEPRIPTQLRQDLGLTSGTMSTRLKRLAEAGLVTPSGNDADGRCKPVEITAAGRRRWQAATSARTARETELFRGALSGRELAALNGGLGELLGHLESVLGPVSAHDAG